jgi:drug/metabolite transporter (DMT)-like permease
MLSILIAVLCAYMLLVHYANISLPALLPLAVVMLALHWRHFQYSRSEMFAMLYAGIFILLIGAGFWYMNQHFVIPGKPAMP